MPTEEASSVAARIGIDLGGTKIEGVMLAAGGEVLASKRTPAPRGDYNATLRAIGDLVGSARPDDPTALTNVSLVSGWVPSNTVRNVSVWTGPVS